MQIYTSLVILIVWHALGILVLESEADSVTTHTDVKVSLRRGSEVLLLMYWGDVVPSLMGSL